MMQVGREKCSKGFIFAGIADGTRISVKWFEDE